jgi:hypothetical protein
MTRSSDVRSERRRIFREAMLERGNRAAKKVYAHKQVLSLATEIAHETYMEIMERDNELYAEWKSLCPELTPEKCEELFVEMIVPKLLEPARAILARMLGMDQYKHLHESIYEALCQDNILRQGRNAPQGRPLLTFGKDGDAKVTRH